MNSSGKPADTIGFGYQRLILNLIGRNELTASQTEMAMNRLSILAVATASLAVGVVLGTFLHDQSARAQAPAYKVLQMTARNAGQLEKILNEQAGAGWHYNSDIDNKLFIFERR